MRTCIGFIVMASFLLCKPYSSFAQKVLLTLAAGEQLLYAESSLSLFDTDGGLQVCASNSNGQYFVYKNNNKLGPYSDLQKVAGLIEYPDEFVNDDNSNMLVNEAYNENFVSMDENGNSYITFGNKKWGPYSLVKDLYLSKQNQKFWAVVVLPQTDYTKPLQYQLIGSSAQAVNIKGEPYDLKVNKDLSMATLAAKHEIRGEVDVAALNKYNEELEKLMAEMGDELDMDKLAEMVNEMGKLGEQSQLQATDFYVYSSKGSGHGPFKTMLIGEKNPAFCSSEGSNWYFIADGFLYKNGSKTASLTDTDINKIWWSANAQSYAYSTYEKLVFSSGEQYPFPLEMKTVNENGKTTLKWLALEDGHKFVLYSKTLQ
jgi:hypothetical protein